MASKALAIWEPVPSLPRMLPFPLPLISLHSHWKPPFPSTTFMSLLCPSLPVSPPPQIPELREPRLNLHPSADAHPSLGWSPCAWSHHTLTLLPGTDHGLIESEISQALGLSPLSLSRANSYWDINDMWEQGGRRGEKA